MVVPAHIELWQIVEISHSLDCTLVIITSLRNLHEVLDHLSRPGPVARVEVGI